VHLSDFSDRINGIFRKFPNPVHPVKMSAAGLKLNLRLAIAPYPYAGRLEMRIEEIKGA
jgi:hypothetical protein